jgi:hypothetical protein
MRSRPNLESRPSQTARIVSLLRERSPHWVGPPEILELRISQYSARIHQARHKWGLPIENRTRIVGGKKHSWFRLVENPRLLSALQPEYSAAVSPPSLFGELAPERYPD